MQSLKKIITLRITNTVAVSLLGYWLFFVRQALASPKPALPKFVKPTSLAPENTPETTVLARFEIIGNNVLAESELERVLKPYLFRPISFVELLEVQQVITQLYIDRGYFTTGAYIPPQTIFNRTVKVEIIEGRIEEIEILGLEKLQPEYIRSRIAIAAEPPLHRDKLLRGLQMLQLNPLIKNISAELSKGVNPGASFLKLEIEEADSFGLELGLDNYASTSIGSVRRRVSINDLNFLGFGDSFQAAYVQTDGSESLERLEYQVPLGARGSSLELGHSRHDSNIIVEPFQDLDLESNSYSYEATFIQTAIAKPTQDLILGFSFTHQNTQLSLGDSAFPDLARGSDADGRTIISALRLVQEYSDRSQNHIFSARSQFAIGIDAFGSTINHNELPDSKFLIWRGQLQYLKAISSNNRILLRGELQLSDRPLFSQEQFNADGLNSVRGYNQARILGDNGFFLSAELNNTVLQIPQWELSLDIGCFFDFGRIWNSDDVALETNTISSLGIMAQLAIADNLTARIDWGFPLIDDKLPQGDSLQDRGIYFSLNFQPF
ncbi:MAG: ShlB/FhaC/HecB family hemolysin secretion/activation protein [Pleurocapsa sp. MO_226.B13]|nr:ShlB/FhaC/HecB family hemolysin secretion/activation protein [Pleurocapsa sp. MO_226.B13]